MSVRLLRAAPAARRLILPFALLGALILPAAAGAAPLAAPALQSPAADATVQQIPVLTWAPVSHAATYEVQLSADSGFGSLVTGDSVRTSNTAYTLEKMLADGTYYWRVRGVTAKGRAGRWAATRTLNKTWSDKPALSSPLEGQSLNYPAQPIVLRWSRVDDAVKYRVLIATDRSLAQTVISDSQGVETTGNAFALPGSLAAGPYYWAVYPVDPEGHRGTRSAVGSFVTTWDATTTGHFADVNPDPRLLDPELSWDPVLGAAAYNVEINSSDSFSQNSKVCCDGTTIATSLSPTDLLPNNTYYWRVRAVDPDNNAGTWITGPSFTKVFDAGTPSIPNLRIRDNQADPAADSNSADALIDTNNPVVAWDAVPGAAKYEVQVTRFNGVCDWTQRLVDQTTTNTAWVPRSSPAVTQPGSGFWPGAQGDQDWLNDGESYCVQVLAVAGNSSSGAVLSEWTTIGGADQPAFRYHAPAPSTAGTPSMTAADYVSPTTGGPLLSRTPLLTWKRVASADSYWVVVARDSGFTNVVEVGFTRIPAYALRGTLSDETTSYYWVVLPAKTGGSGGSTTPSANSPQAFDKRTTPPKPQTPANGADVAGNLSFHWLTTESAYKYRFQVATDPSFAKPLTDIATAAPSYSPPVTFPADTTLYWRVRAIDGSDRELSWSDTQSFRRRLPVPVPLDSNPSGGETIPVLSWSTVQGALSYDMHVEQADGTTRDFNTRSTAFTPTEFYGTGVWRWQIRANFSGKATGPYSDLVPYTRALSAPKNAQVVRTKKRIVFQWDPTPAGKSYRVQVSKNTSFTDIVDSYNPEGTTWAPDLAKDAYIAGGKLYWRVAAVDNGGNVGAYTNGLLTLKRKIKLDVGGAAIRKQRTQLTITVRDLGNRTIGKATVKLSGAGVRMTRRANRKGVVKVNIRPRRRGTIVITGSKKGLTSGSVKVKVG